MIMLLLAGCSDAEMAQWEAMGTGGHIACYSGGVVIYEGDATGKILSEQGSDGWFFAPTKGASLVRVSGDCVITN
jgi:hypothetical protein